MPSASLPRGGTGISTLADGGRCGDRHGCVPLSRRDGNLNMETQAAGARGAWTASLPRGGTGISTSRASPSPGSVARLRPSLAEGRESQHRLAERRRRCVHLRPSLAEGRESQQTSRDAGSHLQRLRPSLAEGRESQQRLRDHRPRSGTTASLPRGGTGISTSPCGGVSAAGTSLRPSPSRRDGNLNLGLAHEPHGAARLRPSLAEGRESDVVARRNLRQGRRLRPSLAEGRESPTCRYVGR